MELDVLILLHIILLAICAGFGTIRIEHDHNLDEERIRRFDRFVVIMVFFIPLEILYWLLHWMIVP